MKNVNTTPAVSHRSFLPLYFQFVFRPSHTAQLLLQHKHRLRYAMYAMLINAAVYTAVYAFLIMGGGGPFKPWLRIPDEVYYHYNVFFAAPSMFLGWILAAGLVQFVSRSFANKGSFEDILVLFAFGIGVASWTTSVHDLVTSFLGGVYIIDQNHYEHLLNTPTIWRDILWTLFGLYLAAFIIYFSKSVHVVYRCSKSAAIFLGTAGFIIYQLFFLIFNR